LTRLHAQHKIESEDYHAALAVTDGERAALKEQLREVRARVQQAQAERAAMAALIAKYKRRLAGDENGEGTVFCFAGPDECRQVLADFVERIVYDRASDTITVAYKPRLAQWQQEMAQLFDDEQDYSVRAILGPG
jgi:multidrug resistance efflux pump